MTDNPPYSNPPRRSETDAVVTLLAGDIRCPLDHQSGTGSKAVTTKYAVDIMPDTSGGQHRSHSVAYATPEWKSNGAFEKLKERLARLTEDFAIPPDPEFIRQLTDGP